MADLVRATLATLLLFSVLAAPALGADKLTAALRATVAANDGPPGAIALVQKRDAPPKVYRAGERLRATDHMRMASTSKAYNGAVALSLVEKGVLGLDSTVGQLVPGAPAAWAPVKLRELLGHTSGIPAYTDDKVFLNAFGKNPRRSFTHRQLWEYVAKKPLRFPPGTRYFYSNTDNILAALMVEAAAGVTYEKALQSEIFGPLALTQTSMPAGFAMPRPYISGYDDGQDVTTAISASGVWASGGLVSTPLEMNAFIRGYVGLKLFSQLTADQQRVFRGGHSEPPGPGRNTAGLALFKYETRCGTMLGHTGNFPGYTQFMAATPDGRTSVTVSVNTQLSQLEKKRTWDLFRRAEEQAVCTALSR